MPKLFSQKHVIVSSTKPLIICITGPESSGKSTLAQAFSNHSSATVITEYAREYLSKLSRPYESKDLLEIAEQQHKLITSAQTPIVISDTGVEVVKIWHEEKFGPSAHLDQLFLEQQKLVAKYWLCKPDMPWQPDPLRENPTDRMRLFLLYKKLLEQHRLPFTVMSGSHPERMTQAKDILKHKKTLD